MLSALRRAANTWVVRLLFVVLVCSFGLWGVADMLRVAGTDTAVAHVAGQRIEVQEAQTAYQRQLAELGRMMPNFSPTPQMRHSVAEQVVDQLVTQAVIQAEAHRLGLVVPDAALRQATFAMPAFHGSNGQFDRATFESVLQRNGMDEPRFLALMRSDLEQRQLLEALQAGVAAPDVLARNAFQYQTEKRGAEAVELPFASAPPPPAPTEAQLQRYWENNPDKYSTPEYRRIKAVVLSPQTMAKDETVSDQELHALYDQRQSLYQQPEKRSVEVLAATDQAKAQELAKQWRGGADWQAMQNAAKAQGATALALDDAAAAEFPDPDLAKAVFAAAPDTVSDPVHDSLGWHVVKVTKVTPPVSQSFDKVKDTLRQAIAEQKAADQIDADADKVEDALAGGAQLDELPQGLGLAAVAGTLDEQGNSLQGPPAPIPGPPALRDALIAAAFQMKPGDPPHLTPVPGEAPPGQSPGPTSYYAVSVDSITPPAQKPFAQVKDQVRQDWTQDALRHEQEVVAARMLTTIKGGKSIEDAALVAGAQVRKLPPVGRRGGEAAVPSSLVAPLFHMTKGEPTMVETPDAFVVAVLTDIQDADPKSDPIGYDQAKQAMTHSMQNDVQTVYVTALRERMRPRINAQMVDSIAQP